MTVFIEVRPSQAVVWTEPSEELKTLTGKHGDCSNVLAIVTGADRGTLKLRPVERL
jgi:hypothetical protein